VHEVYTIPTPPPMAHGIPPVVVSLIGCKIYILKMFL